MDINDFEDLWYEAKFSSFSTLAKSFAMHRYPRLDASRQCRPYLLLGHRNRVLEDQPLAQSLTNGDKDRLLGELAATLYLARPEWFALIFSAATPSGDIICCDLANLDTRSCQYVALGPEGLLRTAEESIWVDAAPNEGWLFPSITSTIERWREREAATAC